MSQLTEAEAENRIRDTYDQVRIWHRTPLFEPNLGAQLREDDEQWPGMAMSQMVKWALDIAAEHLYSVQVLIEAGQLMPTALRTVLRTAVVGSAQAVWLLAPDDVGERMKRHRALMNETYTHHLKYLNGLLELGDALGASPDDNTVQVRDHVQRRRDQIGTLRTFADERARWNDTDVIERAAKHAWSKQPQVEDLAKEAVLEWRAGSGAVHGLVWPLLGSAATTATRTPDRQGLAVFEASGSLLRIVNHYMLAYALTGEGWDLLRRRGL